MYTAANPPRVCPDGHRLGPYQVLVSFSHCECDRVVPRSVGHTTWKCRTCDVRIYGDGHTDDTKLFT